MRDLDKEGAAHKAIADEAAEKVERQTMLAAAQPDGSLAKVDAERILGQMQQNAAIAQTNRSLFESEGQCPDGGRRSRALTLLQRYVLNNLDHVRPWPYKLKTVGARQRYMLEGKECTAQITGLVVRGRVKVTDGQPERTGKAED